MDKFPGILPSNLEKIIFRRLDIKKYARAEFDLCTADTFLEHRYRPGLDVYISGHPDFSYQVKTIDLGDDKDIGFRDDGPDKPVYGAAIGDSFTWGVGVGGKDIWVEKLEDMLGRDVINMGYSYRFGSLQELRLLKKYGLRLKTRVVIWQFFLNDYFENIKFLEWEKSGLDFKEWRESLKKKNAAREKKRLTAIRKFLEDNSTFYRLGKWWVKKKVLRDNNYLEPLGVKFSNGQLNYVFHAWMFEEADLTNQIIKKGCYLTQEAVKQAFELCREIEASLVVVIVPTKEQASWKFAGPLLFKESFDEIDIDEPNQVIEEFCKTHGIPCLNLTSPFREKTETGAQLYFREDGHWNEKGHELGANLIYKFLLSKRII